MLLFAAAICTTALVWLLAHLRHGLLLWRRTGLFAALVIITVAGIVATCFASNRYTAIIGAINLISQIILAVLLVQLLDTPPKRRLILCVIVAAGVTLAYRCWEQRTYENPDLQAMIAADPDQALQAQGIEPGSYAAQQFFNRLASGDVGGFFTVSNMAGSVFVLTIMTTLGLTLEKLRRPPRQWLAISLISATLAAQIYGLLLTRSTGAIAALLLGLAILVVLWCGRSLFSKYWRTVLGLVLVGLALGIIATVVYGVTHNCLPTLSLWVRWQYWTTTASMIADHWLTGVGPQNFGAYYLHYMPAGTGEAIKDPHCMWLSLWSQWGLLGLIGALCGTVCVTLRLARPIATHQISNPDRKTDAPHKSLWLWPAIIIVATVLIRRATSNLTDVTPEALPSVYLLAFILPAIIWLLSFAATFIATRNLLSVQPDSLIPLALGSALLAFLLHNSIDQAIFNPGVGTLFFTCTALALACRNIQSNTDTTVALKSPPARIVVACTSIVLIVVLWLMAYVAVTAHRAMSRAQIAALNADYDTAQNLTPDLLDPEADFLAGRIKFLQWQTSATRTAAQLGPVTKRLLRASHWDRANYRYPLELSRVYRQATHPGQSASELNDFRELARQYANEAAQRYPTKSELLIEYADLLHQMNRPGEALTQYEKALAHEQAYLDQQRAMHGPDVLLRPRLRPELANHARNRISQLKLLANP